MTRRRVALVAVFAIATAMTSSACGKTTPATTTDAGKKLIIGVDLPFQGAQKDASDATWNAMSMYLEQVNSKAGKYTVELKKYDDSTAAKGAWDAPTCTKNATDHVANADEVAVMGTYNSGCAKLQVGTLNQDPKGPMLMVSHANTNVGLTKKWEPGEPEKYYPTGVRNYARVVTTDDNQGGAAAKYVAGDLKLKKCYVLNDNETYGQGVAKAFAEAAKKEGIEVVGEEPWIGKKGEIYTTLFTKIKATNPDCIYFGGIADNNGAQLIKDKVAILGDNTGAVKLIAPDGFTGVPEVNSLKEAQGMYLTFPGLGNDQLRALGGEGAKFLDSFKAKYKADPASPYALYGVQALQVILAAIEKSDGTRKSITAQVLSGSGISIDASKSMLGKALSIDPKTGDVNVKDLSVEVIKDNKETFVKAINIA